MLNLDPIWQPDTQQACFRLLLDAMARPGQCHDIVYRPVDRPSVLSVLATLLDAEVSLADPHALLHRDDWPMLQAKSGSAEQADYVICDGNCTPNFTPKLGTLPSPEQSATLILLVDELGQQGIQLKLSGPGIDATETLLIKGLNPRWLSLREEWNSAFPLGVDIILADSRQLTALPRTTQVEVI